MEARIARLFISKAVLLLRQGPQDSRPFKLYGIIQEVTDDCIVFKTNQGLGIIRLCDVVSITEAK